MSKHTTEFTSRLQDVILLSNGQIDNERIIAQDMDRINELFETLQGVTSALARVLDKHDPDSIEYEWIGNAHEIINAK